MAAVTNREVLSATFGMRLKARRKALGLKQESLARAVGYDNHTMIVKIEGGLILPSFDKAVALAEVLQVSLDDLLDERITSALLFPNLTRLLQATPKEATQLWIAFLRAFADDLEQHEGRRAS